MTKGIRYKGMLKMNMIGKKIEEVTIIILFPERLMTKGIKDTIQLCMLYRGINEREETVRSKQLM